MHFTEERRMNLPYFLLKSMTKMGSRVQAHLENTKHNVFYHGLIKLLILEELNKTQRSWQHFLFWVGFQTKTQESSEAEKNTPVKK